MARLAPIYGDINVLAGIDGGVTIDADRNVSATIAAGRGTVLVQGIQRPYGANDLTNPNNTGLDGGTTTFIGHGGSGQFGEMNGDITVQAGNDVSVLAGGQRSPATIGHLVHVYHYWNPTSTADAQIRFFNSSEDFQDPLLRRGELFTGFTNINQQAANDTFTGTRTAGNNQLSDPTAGALGVEALDGAVANGFHGNITVESVSGDVTVKGFETPADRRNAAGDLVTKSLQARYARIGHGGMSPDVNSYGARKRTNGSGYRPGISDRNTQEFIEVAFRQNDFDVETGTGAVSLIGGNTGSDVIGQALTFVTITGDIDVNAGGDVVVEAGNEALDAAQIGHGGSDLADYETSSFVIGNIDINAGGSLLVQGGGETATDLGTVRHMRSHAMVGHGGYRAGFLSYHGDISVDVGGDVSVRGGSYGDNFAKIGHRGSDDWGQVGGEFGRPEEFNFDGVSIGILSEVVGNTATVTYTDNGGVSAFNTAGVQDLSRSGIKYDNGGRALSGGSRSFIVSSSSANISINAGGDVKLDHLETKLPDTGDNASNSEQRRDSFSQIGHGGTGERGFNNSLSVFFVNPSSNYYSLVGDVSVQATGDVIQRGGDAQGAWSRIGHGLTGRDMRVRNVTVDGVTINRNVFFGGAVDVAARNVMLEGDLRFGDSSYLSAGEIYRTPTGDVTVQAGERILRSGKTVVDGSGNVLSVFGYEAGAETGDFVRDNGLAIGHGVFSISRGGAVDVSVVDSAAVNGVITQSDISVTASEDISIVGGEGTTDSTVFGNSGAYSQIGHGMSSSDANAVSSFGFNGDINIQAARDLIVEGTNNGNNTDVAVEIADYVNASGGAAIIGHGGIHLDASARGNINAFAGNNLQLGQDLPRRPEAMVNGGAAQGALFNFAKIGHVSTSLDGISAVNVGTMTGDVSVVVGNDLDMWGSRVTNHSVANASNAFSETLINANEGVSLGFAQIGHGGPEINGLFTGDIDVLVGNNLTTHDGSIDSRVDALETNGRPFDFKSPNNYVKIGHGDWLRDSLQSESSTGIAQGDIVVAVGNSIDFENTLVGHVDPALGNAMLVLDGTTTVAVSRDFPFYGGQGVLKTTGITDQGDAADAILAQTGQLSSTVLTSGLSGSDELKLFMPERASNEIDSERTRLNQADLASNDTSNPFLNHGGGHPTGSGPFAGESDEVFLAPDLWWMSAQDVADGTAANFPDLISGFFPSAAGVGQGGANTTVTDPGGLPNLAALTTGALGTSTNGSLYRAANGQNGGLYTFYYDVVEPIVDPLSWTFQPDVVTETPTGPVGPTVPFDYSPFVFPELFDTFERLEEGIDGQYGNQPDMQFNDELPYLHQLSDSIGIPPWFVEEFLDNNLGPRQSGERPSYGQALQEAGTYNDGLTLGALQSDIAEEDSEELERRLLRENRTNTKMGLPFYLYDPSTNRYSSLRIFGNPR